MRITPETLENLAMAVLEVQAAFQAGLIEQAQRFIVYGPRFTVHVRHIEEGAFPGLECLIIASGHRLLGQDQATGSAAKACAVSRWILREN